MSYQEDFINEIAGYVKKYNKQFGIELVSPIVAQACKESAFGTSELAVKAKNILGIKLKTNWQKRTPGAIGGYNKETKEEYKIGQITNINATFAVFNSWEECVLNYFYFITTVSNYKGCIGLKDANTYCHLIKQGGYATGSNYDNSLINDYMVKYNLYKFDNDIIIIKPEDTKPIIQQPVGYTNSPLVSYVNLTNHHSGERTHKIDTITIHCIVGQWTAKKGCDYFATTTRECSANYVVGKDGDIGLSVEEKNRSWCSSSKENDQRAVTIETASDATHPYAITDAALNSLIQLCADICIRNGIPALKFSYDKNERINHLNGVNMTCHRDFAAKACPGDYIYNKEEYIANEVNKILGNGITPVIKPVEPTPIIIKPEDTQLTKEKNTFNFMKYADMYADLKNAFGYDKEKLWNHYLTYGKKEGRKVFFDLKVEENTYLVQVKITDLNIRKGPGTNYARTKFINPGIYTIVETQGEWGKLKSGEGWICLKYAIKL